VLVGSCRWLLLVGESEAQVEGVLAQRVDG
jgi:hypothetical protein